MHLIHRVVTTQNISHLLIMVLANLVFCSSSDAVCSPDKFKIGDQVEFKFLGQTMQGEITGFPGTNWPQVTFRHRDRERVTPFPPTQLKKVDDAKNKNVPDKSKTSETPHVAAPIAMAEIRTWTDATGRFKIEAELLAEKNGNVELKKTDGRVVSLPVN